MSISWNSIDEIWFMTFNLRLVSYIVTLIKWARERKCEYSLRVNRKSTYVESNYQTIY